VLGIFIVQDFFWRGEGRSVLGSETYLYVGGSGDAGLASNRIRFEEYLGLDLVTLADGYRVGVIP
jgi:hypothetical protein